MKKLLLLILISTFLFSCSSADIDFCEEKQNETKEEKEKREYFCQNPVKKGYYKIEL